MKQCSICLNQVGKHRFKTSCNHSFHSKCLLKWILTSDTCPMCRTHIRNSRHIIEEPIEISPAEIFFLMNMVEEQGWRFYS